MNKQDIAEKVHASHDVDFEPLPLLLAFLQAAALALERLPGANRCPIATKAFEHRDRRDRESPELGEVRNCPRLDNGAAPAEFRQCIGVEYDGLSNQRLSAPSP